jgi:hypothetical protein
VITFEDEPKTPEELQKLLVERHSGMAEGFREAAFAARNDREVHDLRIQLLNQQHALTAQCLAVALNLLAASEKRIRALERDVRNLEYRG